MFSFSLKGLTSLGLTSALVLNTTLAMAGNASGGGGNLDPDKKPEPSEVEAFIKENYQTVVPAILNWEGSTEYFGFNNPFISSIKNRLFPVGKPDIVDMARSTRVSVKVGEVCIDPDTHEQMDGAVLADGTVCIDPVRVAGKSNITNYRLKSMALVAHEMSHKMGPHPKNEQELIQQEHDAKNLEANILSNAEPNITAGRIEQRRAHLKTSFKYIQGNAQNFVQIIKMNLIDDPFLCNFLGMYPREIMDLDKYEGYQHIVGATPLSYKMQSIITELIVRGNNLSNYCVSDDIVKNARREVDPKFDGKNEIPVSELARKRLWAGVYSSRPIRRIDYLDKTDLIQELLYIKVLLDTLQAKGGL